MEDQVNATLEAYLAEVLSVAKEIDELSRVTPVEFWANNSYSEGLGKASSKHTNTKKVKFANANSTNATDPIPLSKKERQVVRLKCEESGLDIDLISDLVSGVVTARSASGGTHNQAGRGGGKSGGKGGKGGVVVVYVCGGG